MIIPIDIELLKRLGITVNQYFLVYMLLYNKKEELSSYIENTGTFDSSDLDILQDRGFIVNMNNKGEYFFNQMFVSEDFNKQIHCKDDCFEEFWEKFPSSYSGRFFKGFKKEVIKTKYNKIIRGDISYHKHILNCLEYELNNTDLKYLRNISTWLNNETWKAYEDKIVEGNGSNSFSKDI